MKLIPCSFHRPNAYVDLFMPYLESDEWRVLSYAIRHIFGWDDRIEDRRRRMSISTFEHGVPSFPGCGLSRPAIVRVLGNLSKYGLMKKIGKPTSQGQLFELPVDSAEIDLEGLKQRLEEKKAKSTKRTQKARKTKKERANQPEAVNGTNQQAVSPINQLPVNGTNREPVSRTNQDWLVPLTGSGKSDIPTQIQLSNPAFEIHPSNPSSNAKSDDDLSSSMNEKSKAVVKPFDPTLDSIATMEQCWREYFKEPIPVILSKEVATYSENYAPEQIREAFTSAASYGGRAWAYVRKCFDNMERKPKKLTGKDYTVGKFADFIDNTPPEERKASGE